MAFVTLTTVISALIGIINPAFSRVFLDRLLTGVNPDWFMPFIIALAALGVVQIAVAWVQAVYSLRINGKLAALGSTEFMWKVLRLPMEFFAQRVTGDIQNRKDTNAGIANTIVNTLAPLALNMAIMVFYLAVMLRYSPMLTLVGLLPAKLNSIIFSEIVVSGSARTIVAMGVFLLCVNVSSLIFIVIKSMLLTRINAKMDAAVGAAA